LKEKASKRKRAKAGKMEGAKENEKAREKD
jgi:hypothetical protein